MFVSLIIILLITLGGAALTYLFNEEETLLWRLSAGNIIGSAIFGIVGFLLACAMDLSVATVLIAVLVAALPLLLLRKDSVKKKFHLDKQVAKSKFQGESFKKLYRFLYYAAIFIVLWLFFDQAMITNDEGIFTGASQNFGDLPFHLGAIFSFADGQNFPPQNPSFSEAKFTYPFIADFIAACFYKVGASVQNAMFLQNLFLGFSLVVILEKFVFRLTNNRLAGKIAPLILLFSGGLGFLAFFRDYWQGTQGFFEYLGALPRDFTINENFRWGNSLVVLFITQRSLLLGMPLTLVVLNYLWNIFIRDEESEGTRDGERKKILSESLTHKLTPSLTVGLLAGTLPLIHAHSLFVLFVVTGFLFFFRMDKWREWIAFGIGVSIIAVPLLIWITTGSATNLTEFIGWHFGWDKRENNFIWFWFKNTGLFIPLLIAGIGLFVFYRRDAVTLRDEKVKSKKAKGKRKKIKKNKVDEENSKNLSTNTYQLSLLKFYLPFFLLFVVSNSVKLAPWEWDNIKILIYWFVSSIPFVAVILAWAWSKDTLFKVIAAGCLIVLTFSGALDVWRTISGEIRSKVYDKDAVEVAEKIRENTEPNALFLNTPTFNSAIVLSGRRSLMRYPGHLSSHGINYEERLNDLKRIYEGEGTADIFLKKYDIDYVLISPELRAYARDASNNLKLNEAFFEKYQKYFEIGQYKVYKVK